jgi:hypothetical protein
VVKILTRIKRQTARTRYLCSDPKNVPIVLHTQDWLKANLVDHPVKGNVDSQLTRLQPFILDTWSIVEIQINKQLGLPQGQDLGCKDQY